MSPRRDAPPGPAAVLVVCKPVGMTSHDVVDVVRRIVGTRRVGHTGTLDPGAAGVLVLVTGRATRLAEFIAEADKAYRVQVVFGRATDTGDAYGATLSERPDAAVDRAALEAVLARFVGTITQIPPMASAVHVGGRRLYEHARAGAQVKAPPRQVRIDRIDLREFDPGPPAVAWLDVACSKGTYIRRLALDIGDALGPGAHAAFMLRTRVGPFGLDEAWTLEELADLAAAGRLDEALRSPDEALAGLPAVELSAPQRQAVLHGQALPLFRFAGWQALLKADLVRLRDAQGLVALARVEAGMLRPVKVLRDG